MSDGRSTIESGRSGLLSCPSSTRLLAESISLAVVLLLSLLAVIAERSGIVAGGGYASSLLLLIGSLAYVKIFRVPVAMTRLDAASARFQLAMLFCGLIAPAVCALVPLTPQSNWVPGPAQAFHLLLLVPISEELYFRGLLLSHLQRGFGTVRAVLFSSLFFMVLHQGLAAIAVAGGLSIVACLLVLKGKSLVLAAQLHVLWNGLTYVNRIEDQPQRWLYAAVTAGIIVLLLAAQILFRSRPDGRDRQPDSSTPGTA